MSNHGFHNEAIGDSFGVHSPKTTNQSERRRSINELLIINELPNEGGGSSKSSSLGGRGCDIHDTELDDTLPTPYQ